MICDIKNISDMPTWSIFAVVQPKKLMYLLIHCTFLSSTYLLS